jgi:hypothetical protein
MQASTLLASYCPRTIISESHKTQSDNPRRTSPSSRNLAHTYIHTYIHTCMHTYIHACMHTYIHTCMHTYIHTNTHKCRLAHCWPATRSNNHFKIAQNSLNLVHTYILTYIHTYVHTYIHTYMHAG